MNILIYSEELSNRLIYIVKLICDDLMGLTCEFTTNTQNYLDFSGPKINYSKLNMDNGLQIVPYSLLFERLIKPQEIKVLNWEGIPIFYSTDEKSKIPFDIFAASFLLVSRYEEYSDFRNTKSIFRAEESLAFKNGFLDRPIINEWVIRLRDILKKKYRQLNFSDKTMQFQCTFDIDNTWAYLNKGFLRIIGGILNAFIHFKIIDAIKRIYVLLKILPDPFYTYELIKLLEVENNFKTYFFFLCGSYSKYDKNVPPGKKVFKRLVSSLSQDHTIGIHPSFVSNYKSERLIKEISILSGIINKPVLKSRQHYLVLNFPETYKNLIDHGIAEDYTMGYSTHTGYRAGICSPFRFYNLTEDEETRLLIYPFAVMDITLMQYMKLKPDEAIEKIKSLQQKIREVKGLFIPIWHNDSLSDYGVWKGWKDVFIKMIGIVND